MLKNLKLGTKITSLLIVLVILSVTIIGILSTRDQVASINNNLSYTTKELSIGLSSQVNGFINEHVSVIEAISYTNDMKLYNSQDQTAILESIVKQHSEFALIFATDKNGQQVARSDGKTKYDNNSDRDYFKAAISEKKTVISNVLISKTTGKPAVVIAVPLFSENGDFQGILGATLDLSVIEEMRSKIKLGETGYAFITDAQGQILAHPDQAKVDEKVNVSDISVVSKALKGESGSEKYDYEGKSNFAGFSQVPGTGWTIVVTQSYDEVFASVTKTQIKVVSTSVIILVITIIIGVVLSKGMIKPLLTLKEAAKQLSQGNLTHEFKIKTGDEVEELADSFIEMREGLKTLIEQISSASENVLVSTNEVLDSSKQAEIISSQIAEATSQLALGSDEQSKSVEHTLESINNIVQAIEEIASNTEHSMEASSQAEELINIGTEVVKAQDTKMKESTIAVDEVSQIIFMLNDKTIEVGQIIEVIESIAEQTNLLALNAAIEAARAGEQGRGFAVVADEVRKLAEESKNSIGRIQSIIRDIQNTTTTAVNNAKHATDTISEQNEAVKNTTMIFKEILGTVNAISTQIQEIANSTDGVKNAGENIQQDMERILAVSEETAASTEEVTASTEEQSSYSQNITNEVEKLSNLAQNLKAYTERFKV